MRAHSVSVAEETPNQQLPEGWTAVPIADVVLPVPNTKPEDEPTRLFGYIDISAIDNTRQEIVQPKTFRGAEAPSRARRPVQPGDVLFSNVRTYLRNIALVPDGLPVHLCSTGFTVLRPGPAVDPRFLFRYVLTDGFIDRVTPQQTGTHYPATSDAVVLSESIAVPPLAEQKRIVAKVEELLAAVNAARERLARVPAILKRVRQAVLAAACSGRLTEDWRGGRTVDAAQSHLLQMTSNELPEADQHLEGVELPDGWARARVDALVRIQNGRAFPSKQYQEVGVRLLRPGNLHASGRVEWTADNTAYLAKSWALECSEFVLGAGELLINLTAQSLKDEFLGRACIKDDDEPALLNQRIARLVPHGEFDVRPFLLLCFKSNLFRSFVNGLDTGSLIRHMHSKDVARHVVMLPPRDEQHEIVRRVEVLFRLADAIERHAAAATQRVEKLTQAILAKAFRGELVPTEAEVARREGRDYEPAEVLLERIRAERAVARKDSPASRDGRRRKTRANK